MGGYSGLRLTASPLRSPVLALAVALPIVFVHIRYQPSLVVGSGTKVTVTLADLAILAVALVTLAVAVRARLRPLRTGLPLWVAGGVFLLYGIARAGNGTHLVSAVKFAEYGVLALAVPVLVRGRDELRLLLWTVALWSAVASIVGLAQFFGAGLADGWGAGTRQPSFLGQLDFAALSGMALAAGLAGLAFGAGRVAGGDSGRERGAGLLVGWPDIARVGDDHVSCRQNVDLGEVAVHGASHGIVLHQLADQSGSLEDAYLEVTNQTVEYRGTAK